MRQRKTLDRDNKVLKIVKQLDNCSILEILDSCIKNYPIYEWSYHIIRNSITRLYCNGDISFDKKNANIIFKKTSSQNRTLKTICVRNNKSNNEDFLLGGFYNE